MEALLDVGHDDTVAHRVDAHDEVGNVLVEWETKKTLEIRGRQIGVTNLLLTSNVCLFVNPTYYTDLGFPAFRAKQNSPMNFQNSSIIILTYFQFQTIFEAIAENIVVWTSYLRMNL